MKNKNTENLVKIHNIPNSTVPKKECDIICCKNPAVKQVGVLELCEECSRMMQPNKEEVKF